MKIWLVLIATISAAAMSWCMIIQPLMPSSSTLDEVNKRLGAISATNARIDEIIADIDASKPVSVELEHAPFGTAFVQGGASQAAAHRWNDRLEEARRINANASSRAARSNSRASASTSTPKKRQAKSYRKEPKSLFERSRHYQRHGSVYDGGRKSRRAGRSSRFHAPRKGQTR